jgi:hypothetical protein
MKTSLKLVTLGALLGLAACGGGSQPAPPATSAPAPTQPPATQPVVTAGQFGVAECDDYMAKYLACVDSKVPEAARAMVRQQLEQTKDAWQKAAATPEGKAGLATGCKAAADAAKTSMAAYGCTF